MSEAPDNSGPRLSSGGGELGSCDGQHGPTCQRCNTIIRLATVHRVLRQADIPKHAYEGNWPYEPCGVCGRDGMDRSHFESTDRPPTKSSVALPPPPPGLSTEGERDEWRKRFALARPGHEAHFERAIDSVLADPYGAYANEIRETAARRAPGRNPYVARAYADCAHNNASGEFCHSIKFDFINRTVSWPVGHVMGDNRGDRSLGARRGVRDGRRLGNARSHLQRGTRLLERLMDAVLRRNGDARQCR